MALDVKLDRSILRSAIQEEYSEVAGNPARGFHFHTGRTLAGYLGYDAAVERLPDSVIESFAGVGNPFHLAPLEAGAVVLDLGSGAGLDSILAAKQIGPSGQVIGVDMTLSMVEKARANAALAGVENIEFVHAYAENLPITDAAIDVVISNGVINLCPDKMAVFRELHRVLKPGGRLQIADIVVKHAVPEDAKEDISLWTG